MKVNLKLRCVSEICLNDQEYLNNTFSFIKTHHNLTIQPFPTVFQSYKIQLENSDDTSIILIGIFLHFNQSAIGNYKLVMNFNETETDSFQLNKNQISLKLMDYYQLDDSSKENINNTVKFSTSGNLASGISMYLNTFLQSDSSFTFRTFMIIEYI